VIDILLSQLAVQETPITAAWHDLPTIVIPLLRLWLPKMELRIRSLAVGLSLGREYIMYTHERDVARTWEGRLHPKVKYVMEE